jgi:ribosomal protein L17
MTTEIAVANKLGIALAADSAVTISGGGRVKVFDTADKLFELSLQSPIGVMINGNMDCIGVPWEILVKDFRESEGLRERPTVQDWATDFLAYVEGHSLMATKAATQYIDDIIETEIVNLQIIVVNNLREFIFQSARVNRKITVPKPERLIDDYLTDRLAEVSSYPLADSLNHMSEADAIAGYGNRIDELCKPRFEGRQLTDAESAKFKSIVANVLLRNIPSATMAGIAVAGYGTTETFPSVYAFEVDGRVLGKMKVTARDANSITTSPDGGQVTSFAQTDVIQRLLGGADPRFVNKTADYIESAVLKAAQTIEDQTKPRKLSAAERRRRQEMVRDLATLLRDEYEIDTAESLREEFSREFDRMIAMMPKQELIELAEALVSITAVERKATSDEGTVGGPIDVAFITRHEGFVWIKRKHYFEAERNPRYFWRKYGNPPVRTGGINAHQNTNG